LWPGEVEHNHGTKCFFVVHLIRWVTKRRWIESRVSI
jgi:hypothetical protein